MKIPFGPVQFVERPFLRTLKASIETKRVITEGKKNVRRWPSLDSRWLAYKLDSYFYLVYCSFDKKQ